MPDHIPFEVAALNEPMAVARHGVNRCQPKPSDKVVVFGAGPIGLGTTIAFKSLGVEHVVVTDLIANWEKYAVIVSHMIPFDNINEALKTASTPGAADKVVVTFN